MRIESEGYKIVGDSLSQMRKAAGLSQVELADRLGKPQSFVSSYERGQRRVDLMEFLLIVTTMGGDACALFIEIEAAARGLVAGALKR